MNPLLFISSLPFLDLLDNLIVLAAEFVAIFCLNESAHSQFWFMFLLTAMPPITAITGAIAQCTPCKWDDMVIAIGTAVVMNTCFAYFCSGALIDPDTGEQLMGFGELPIVPKIFFPAAGGLHLLADRRDHRRVLRVHARVLGSDAAQAAHVRLRRGWRGRRHEHRGNQPRECVIACQRREGSQRGVGARIEGRGARAGRTEDRLVFI